MKQLTLSLTKCQFFPVLIAFRSIRNLVQYTYPLRATKVSCTQQAKKHNQGNTSDGMNSRSHNDVNDVIVRTNTANINSILDACEIMNDVIEDYDPNSKTRITGKRLIRDKDEVFIREIIDHVAKRIEINLGDAEELFTNLNLFLITIETLDRAIRWSKKPAMFPRTYHESNSFDQTPFFTQHVHDTLCACFRKHYFGEIKSTPEELITLLRCTTKLFIDDRDTFSNICTFLTSKKTIAQFANQPEVLVDILQVVTLCYKRCNIPQPNINGILALVGASSKFQTKHSLSVFASLIRVREDRSLDLVRVLSVREVPKVPYYSVNDIIFGLRASTLLYNVNEVFVIELFKALTIYAPQMDTQVLGTVAHYLVIMKGSQRSSHFILRSGTREIRHLIPALLRRVEQLKGKFSLRDAKYVIQCLSVYNHRHSIVFSQLSSLITEG
eukprot:Tbor_TRINITY_DN5317_c3_g2::TRINITY_DN5317_c3_g2_i1::g.4561::m.4561